MPSYPGGVGLMHGIPHDGKPVTLAWAFSFRSASPPMNYDCRLTVVQGKPVAEARQEIAEAALREKCKYLFFNDTDVTHPPHAIRQLIWHLEHYPKYAVAGGIYCHKSPPQMPMVFRGNGIGPYMDWKIGEVFDVSGIGMGCTLIRCDIFEKLPKPWFKTVDDVTDFMEGKNRTMMWTEDLWFCNLVTTHTDYKIMADGGLLCAHWDTMTNTPYELPKNSKPWRESMPPTLGKKVIDLGSGREEESYRTNEGTVLRVDIRDEVKPDFRCDIRKTPFATGEFDLVYSSHTLEHFSREEVHEVVAEMIRLLKPDGELRLVVPNLAWAAQHIMNKEIDSMVMNVLYGEQTFEENYHKCGFTQEMLEQLLKQAGFKKFVFQAENFHLMCRAWKDENAEVTLINPQFMFHSAPITLQEAEQAAEPGKDASVRINLPPSDNNKGEANAKKVDDLTIDAELESVSAAVGASQSDSH